MQDYAKEIGNRLNKLYPEAHVELTYTSPFELMIATILAAQNNDKNINTITPTLFRKYRTPAAYLAAEPGELETDIHKSGFFNQKAKSIRGVCQKLLDDFGGEVPQTMEELLTLPGIGRKTATVVLGDGMGIAEGITVDMHNIRISPRLGLSYHDKADKIEKDLMEIVDKKHWIKWGQWITWHGRRVCRKKPDCPNCILNDICPTGREILSRKV